MSKFTQFCDDYFKKYFQLHPTEAIYYGIEGYDHLLNDYSDESYHRKSPSSRNRETRCGKFRLPISIKTKPSTMPCWKAN